MRWKGDPEKGSDEETLAWRGYRSHVLVCLKQNATSCPSGYRREASILLTVRPICCSDVAPYVAFIMRCLDFWRGYWFSGAESYDWQLVCPGDDALWPCSQWILQSVWYKLNHVRRRCCACHVITGSNKLAVCNSMKMTVLAPYVGSTLVRWLEVIQQRTEANDSLFHSVANKKIMLLIFQVLIQENVSCRWALGWVCWKMKHEESVV